MRIVFAFVLLVGLGLAGTAAYMVMQKFNQYEANLAEERRNKVPQIETVEVAVAAKPLTFAQKLQPDDVVMIKWPADAVPMGAFTSKEAVYGDDPTVQRTILKDMVANEPIMLGLVSELGGDAGIRSRLAPGMRAVTIRVDVTTGVSGFLQPGDKVDIFWSGESNGRTITKLLLEKVLIIAVDQETTGDSMTANVARTITVEVSPDIVAKLTQAQRTGTLTLSLRGVEDTADAGAIEINQKDITGEVEQVIQEEKVCTITTRKGTEVVELVVPCPQN